MIVTNDAQRAEKLTCLRAHGSKPKYYHKIIGGNFRLDAIQAAIVTAKLPHLDDWTAARQRNAAQYDRLFAGAGRRRIVLPRVATDRHIFNQYVIRVSQRDVLQAGSAEARAWEPRSTTRCRCICRNASRISATPQAPFRESERAANETLALPIQPELTDEQARYVVECVAAFVAKSGAASARLVTTA